METILLGKVTKLHGISGQMKIATMFNKDFDVKKITFLYDENDNGFEVERIFSADGAVVAKLKDVDFETAKTFIGKSFFISREIFNGKILFEDLKNSSVYFEDETLLGKVIDVQDFGSAEVITLSFNNKKELLFPCVKGLIKSFDYKTKKLVISKEKLCEVSDYEN